MIRGMKIKIKRFVWVFSFLAISFFVQPRLAFCHHYSLRIGIIPDPIEVPSREEIDLLEAKALAGDWELKKQFAASYLYECMKLEYWNWGCGHLRYGNLCRAMAARRELGQSFLREIINLNSNGPLDKITLSRFQADYAYRRVFDARPDFDPKHPACQEAVRYYELAIENESTTGDGRSCTAGRVFSMITHQQCFVKNEQQAKLYGQMNWGCPQY